MAGREGEDSDSGQPGQSQMQKAESGLQNASELHPAWGPRLNGAISRGRWSWPTIERGVVAAEAEAVAHGGFQLALAGLCWECSRDRTRDRVCRD